MRLATRSPFLLCLDLDPNYLLRKAVVRELSDYSNPPRFIICSSKIYRISNPSIELGIRNLVWIPEIRQRFQKKSGEIKHHGEYCHCAHVDFAHFDVHGFDIVQNIQKHPMKSNITGSIATVPT